MNKMRHLIGMILAGLLVCAPLAGAAAPSGEFTTEKLANGITFKYKVLKDDPLVSINAKFPIGFYHQSVKGVPHLMEHLVFRGGSGYKFNDIAAVTTHQGGYFNGATSFYATTYNYVVPKAKFGEALKVFNGSLWKTDLTPENVNFEKTIVTHELDMGYARYNYYAAYRCFYPEMDISRQTVEAATPALLKDFYTTFYQPENATYIISGDFDPKEVKAQLEQLSNGYGRLDAAKPEVTAFDLPAGEQVESRNLYPFQYQLVMAYQWKGLSVKDRMLMTLLSYAYGYDSKIDYEHNQYKTYFTLARTIKDQSYFGLFYLERNQPFTPAGYAAEQETMRQYRRQFKKMDFAARVKELLKEVEMEKVQSRESAVDAAQYELNSLDPENISDAELAILKKLTTKDLEQFVDAYLSQPPTTWFLVKTTK